MGIINIHIPHPDIEVPVKPTYAGFTGTFYSDNDLLSV